MARFGIARLIGKSPVAKAAVDAMQALSESPDADYLDDAFASAAFGPRRKRYGERLGAKLRGTSHVCTHRLIRGGRCPDTFKKPCFSPRDLPARDHLKEWHVGGKTVSIVSEPYRLSLGDIRKIAEYADANGLDVWITASDASHYPGQTLHIEWTRKEES